MMMMARVLFDVDKAECGVAALRNQGFTVLTQVLSEEPDYVFAEASRDQANSEGDDTHELADAMLLEVEDIVAPFGSVDDAGPIPVGHVPFQYESPAWRKR